MALRFPPPRTTRRPGGRKRSGEPGGPGFRPCRARGYGRPVRPCPVLAAALLAPLAVCVGGAGCAATENAAAVRADLLTAEDELARAETELSRVRADLAAADREADRLRTRLAEGGGPTAELPEQVRALGRAEALAFSKLLTGGLDRDGRPGDELLAVAVAPVDADGVPVKLAGSVELELLDLSAAGEARTVGAWAFDAADAADRWRSTPLGAGYRFRLPLLPADATDDGGGEDLHLHAAFAAADGRTFDATLPVRVDRAAGTRVAAAEPNRDRRGAGGSRE